MAEVEVLVRDSLLYDQQAEEQLLTLFFPKKIVTARELIRERVSREVEAYNERLSGIFLGLVTPTDAERTLNGYRVPAKRAIDAEKQCQLALEAFDQNGFILLVDDRQVANLDDPVEIHPGSSVVFLKLTPLVGG
jgi:hypothetical protein